MQDCLLKSALPDEASVFLLLSHSSVPHAADAVLQLSYGNLVVITFSRFLSCATIAIAQQRCYRVTLTL
ncbi:uncharacterized protein BO66DRAFT_239570 [Aspergillus aculeatinus CBS 121060]|uniref:Uncharacterized protein n=1 Tax=Aspergillus aculeatinus CBS 121060 TaxID=1448322 RepID=A0ACD1HIP8_9EURO|nr:hypothetical protein BO66DRAFT_239570 [Aspergillus aculeatinus CBS 121060]RAH73306.1 hypothetical protein BO66DRAFT_239570 [Aspergillus aculeatinus CBS 121060]